MRFKNKEKALAYVSSIVAVCQHCDSVAPFRGSGLVGGATPGFAVLRTAPPGVTHGIASPRQVKEQRSLAKAGEDSMCIVHTVHSRLRERPIING